MNSPSQMSNVNGQLSRKAGFTILEFIIYISILSVMSLVIGGSFLSITSGRARNESRAEVSSSIKTVMDSVKNDLKNATNIVAPGIGSNYPALALVVNTDLVSYYIPAVGVNSGKIVRQINGGQAVSLTSSNVRFTGINFEYLQNVSIPLLKIVPNIKVSLTSAYSTNDPARAYSQMSQSTFSLGRLFDVVRPDGTGLMGSSSINVFVPVCAGPGRYCTNPECETTSGVAPENRPPYCPPVEEPCDPTLCDPVPTSPPPPVNPDCPPEVQNCENPVPPSSIGDPCEALPGGRPCE